MVGEDPEQSDTQNGLAGNPLLALVRTGIENDFEEVVFPQYPLLREIKHELMGIPAGILRRPAGEWQCDLCGALGIRLCVVRPLPVRGRCDCGSTTRPGYRLQGDPYEDLAPTRVLAQDVRRVMIAGWERRQPYWAIRLAWRWTIQPEFTGRSTNGRSSAFDALSPGSNPGRPAKSRRAGTRRADERFAPASWAQTAIRVLWRQQHAAEVGRTLDFAESAATGREM